MGGGKQSDPGNSEGRGNKCSHTNRETLYGSGYFQWSSMASTVRSDLWSPMWQGVKKSDLQDAR